jgi:hypothetical protein
LSLQYQHKRLSRHGTSTFSQAIFTAFSLIAAATDYGQRLKGMPPGNLLIMKKAAFERRLPSPGKGVRGQCGIRTHGLWLRRPALYPAELIARFKKTILRIDSDVNAGSGICRGLTGSEFPGYPAFSYEAEQ